MTEPHLTIRCNGNTIIDLPLWMVVSYITNHAIQRHGVVWSMEMHSKTQSLHSIVEFPSSEDDDDEN